MRRLCNGEQQYACGEPRPQKGEDMDTVAVLKAYRRYAPTYDLVFGAVLQPGRRNIIDRLECRPGERVLEVGVGTGLSLPLYPPDVHVVGIDLCPDMLVRARARQRRCGLDNVQLALMDAERLAFDDDSFDRVVAMYVASVVPHPAQLVAEMGRVCRSGGDLYIVNHFRSQRGLVAKVEDWLRPASRLLGFRTELSLAHFVRESGLEVIHSSPTNLFGYWTLLQAANEKGAVSQCASAGGR